MTTSEQHLRSLGAEPGGSAHAGSAATENQGRLLLVLCLTLAYVVAEVAGGLYTHSLALVADAGHMLTDALGLAMALAAIRFAQRPATPQKTYGFYRTEILAALANAILLVAVPSTYSLRPGSACSGRRISMRCRCCLSRAVDYW